jgi:lysophospholipase L1-like esterase
VDNQRKPDYRNHTLAFMARSSKLRLGAWMIALSIGTLAAEEPPKHLRVVLVGDSTVNDEGGWGPGLRGYFGPDVDVVNFARNGRSSKSFRSEGLWAPAIAGKPDYILIQFGHNDGPGKGPERETDPKTTYRENMARYVAEARAAGAQPVLVTSIVRRVFTEDGRIKRDSLVPYVETVRTLAMELRVPLVDLYSLTLSQAETLGNDGCAEIDARLPDGKRDRTHLGPRGRQEIGLMAAQEFVKLFPALRAYVAPAAQQ